MPSPSCSNPVDSRLARWRSRFSDKVFLPVLAVVIGLLSGAAAALLKAMIASLSRLLTSSFSHHGANWFLLLLPFAGILLTGIFVRYVVRIDITHGVEKVLAKIRRGVYRLKARIILSPMVASTLTLAFGGSAGSEGPIATTGAAIGSNLARVFGLPPQAMLMMVGCGAGAGIAGIFKSPIGGFLFTLEVMRIPMTTVSVITLLVCTVVAAVTAYALSGFTPDLVWAGDHTFSAGELPLFLLLGVVCGLYSLYYAGVIHRLRAFFSSIASPWLRNISGALILGVSLLLFPALYGEGYGVMAQTLAGNYSAMTDGGLLTPVEISPALLALICAGMVLVKSFATCASNSAGGVAGDFAPTLFAGCFVGLLFALVCNLLLPSLGLTPAGYAFVGMGGVMAGVIRAPLMALFLIVEMTGCYSLFLPALLVCAVSFGVVRLLSPRR